MLDSVPRETLADAPECPPAPAERMPNAPDRMPDSVPRGTLFPIPDPQSPIPEVCDIGSGAGFPGIPLKLYAPAINLSLVEAHGKKATFLREVIRTLGLNDAVVLNQRAEELLASLSAAQPGSAIAANCSTWNTVADRNAECPKPNADRSTWNISERAQDSRADLVTLRAVEKFTDVLPVAASLVRPRGRLGLLIGCTQIQAAVSVLPEFRWLDPAPIPLSTNRVVLTGFRQER